MVAELAALAPQVSAADLSARRARYLTELGQMKRDLEGQLGQQLSKVAGEIAKEGHLKVVLTKARRDYLVRSGIVFPALALLLPMPVALLRLRRG